MIWSKDHDSLVDSLINVPIRIHTENGYYHSLGTYYYQDDLWWEVPNNRILDHSSVEFLDEGQPNQDVLWEEVGNRVREGTNGELWIPGTVLNEFKNEYILTHK